MRNKLVRCFDCFGDKFRQKKYIKEHIEGIWTSSLKIRAKIEKKTYLSVRLVHGVRLRSWELVGYVCLSIGCAFHGGFLPWKPYFSLKFMLHRGKSTLNSFFPRRWIKDWFQLPTSIGRWKLRVEVGRELAPFFNRQPKNVPKYALKYVFKNKIWNKKKKKKKRIVS